MTQPHQPVPFDRLPDAAADLFGEGASAQEAYGLLTVDVPAAAVITTQDRTVPTRRQRGLAAAIPGCRTYEVAGPHNSAVTIPDVWVPQLLEALDGLALDRSTP